METNVRRLKMKPGDKVCYIPFDGCSKHLYENGIVKSVDKLDHFIFVVYKCNNDWENYKNYTGVSTPITKIKLGWVENENI